MEKKVAYSERRAVDAKKKTEDLLKPLDEIDLALARSDLALADARLHQAEQERVKWLEGPDPDQLAAGSARLEAAEAGLAAAQAALQNAQVVSPMAGTLVDLNVKQGESAIPGQTLAVVADLSDWVVETQDLGEEDVVRLQPGERLSLSLDAYPDVALDGVVESVRQYYTEDEGDVFYHAKIGLKPTGVPLLWGMTARIVPSGKVALPLATQIGQIDLGAARKHRVLECAAGLGNMADCAGVQGAGVALQGDEFNRIAPFAACGNRMCAVVAAFAVDPIMPFGQAV